MIPHHIVFIHGIGDRDRCDHFSDWLQNKILREFHKTALRLSSEAPPQGGIHFSNALWYDVTQKDQDQLWDKVFHWMSPRGTLPEWGRLQKDPMNLIYRLKYWSRLRRFVVDYQGDLIAYIEAPGANKYKLIHDRVYGAFTKCTDLTIGTEATTQNPALLTVVAHSLGAVIASDLLYDVLISKLRWWPPQLRLANLVSLGSPLALYRLRYDRGESEFQKTIQMQDKDGVWINIYDPQDVIGYPLKTLNAAYQKAVFLDKEINAGQWWNPWHFILQNTPFTHNLYLKDNAVAAIIGRKAALDWLRVNKPQLGLNFDHEYAKYRKWVESVKRSQAA